MHCKSPRILCFKILFIWIRLKAVEKYFLRRNTFDLRSELITNSFKCTNLLIMFLSCSFYNFYEKYIFAVSYRDIIIQIIQLIMDVFIPLIFQIYSLPFLQKNNLILFWTIAHWQEAIFHLLACTHLNPT